MLALALASLAAAYNGLVRRRVAETLGQSALMLAMMAGGLWVIADPAGTVGALGRWVDEASAGTLGAVVEGSPAHASRTLAHSMSGLFGGGRRRAVVLPGVRQRPLVRRPRAPRTAAARRRPRAAHPSAHRGMRRQRTAGRHLRSARTRSAAASVPPHSRSATLMRAARTNGELFLALPANEAARNSIEMPGSLLRVLCGGSESATECRGPTAAEAEFRTQGATTPRIAGLLLIAIGAVGMIMLLGFIALHLLGAEILSLLYLLLAPAAVLAPALGDGGRAAFRTWATRLVGAVCSKLIFSFLLGVVLLMTRTLIGLEALGWWTRWLLVAVLWWGAYRQRHQVLGFIAGEHRATSEHHRSLLQRFKQQLEGPRTVMRSANWMRKRLAGPGGRAPTPERRRTGERIGRERAQETADEQVTRMLEHERAAAAVRVAPGSEAQSGLAAKRTQLQRVRGAQERAAAAGDTRRAARLGARAQRIEGEVEHGRQALNEARRTAAEGERAQRTPVASTPPSSCGSAANGSTRRPRWPPRGREAAREGAPGAERRAAWATARRRRAEGGHGRRRGAARLRGARGHWWATAASSTSACTRARSAKRACRSIASSRCAASCATPPAPLSPLGRVRRGDASAAARRRTSTVRSTSACARAATPRRAR